MRTHQLRFEGALLERGFWVYVCRVRHKDQNLLYVGRTGDNPSPFAASPFSRLARHLDLLPSATANTLVRHLRNHYHDPILCSYLLVAVGPLEPEQQNYRDHQRIRKQVGLIEAKLAQQLEADGFNVVGKHPSLRGGVLDHRNRERYVSILRSIRNALKDRRR